MEADDLSLVSQAKDGNDDAFRALVVRYQRKVYALALGVVKDPDLAWDVAQETFVRAHTHLAGFEAKSSFTTWLFRIGTHLAIDAVRRERRAQKEEVDEVNEAHLSEGGEGILSTALGNDPRENVLRRELAEKIEEALATLPEKHRTILVLREVEGLTYEELAERLEIHKGTVMSRLFHARKKMQAALRRYAGLVPREAPQGAPSSERGFAAGEDLERAPGHADEPAQERAGVRGGGLHRPPEGEGGS